MALTKKATAKVQAIVLILRAQDQARRTLGARQSTGAGRKKRSRARKIVTALLLAMLPHLAACAGDATPGPDPGDPDYSVAIARR